MGGLTQGREGLESDINNIIGVHDCFGTHPNDMGQLHHIVRKTFVLQYSDNNFLNSVREKLITFIKLNNFEILEENGKLFVKNNENEDENYLLPDAPPLLP